MPRVIEETQRGQLRMGGAMVADLQRHMVGIPDQLPCQLRRR